ncbi:hypothetical protein VKT23_005966 [Stygiomarasmius scandens]|uniref:RING-type domain-containing protein n=1 Tax=Marasmiellus scandens TaxID=2682957 RepID=A0ABR1JV84_9AGAR
MGQSSSRQRPESDTISPNIPSSSSTVHNAPRPRSVRSSTSSAHAKSKRRRSLCNFVKRRGSSRRSSIVGKTRDSIGSVRRSWRQSRRWSKLGLVRSDQPITKDRDSSIDSPAVEPKDSSAPDAETHSITEENQSLSTGSTLHISSDARDPEQSNSELFAEPIPDETPSVPPRTATPLPPPLSPPPVPTLTPPPRTFPPPGTLVVVQGVVHTTDVPRPQTQTQNSGASNSTNSSTGLNAGTDMEAPSDTTSPLSHESHESPAGAGSGENHAITRTRSESRTRNRLSTLFGARPSSSSGVSFSRRASTASASAGPSSLSRRTSTSVHPVETSTSSDSRLSPEPTLASTLNNDNDTRSGFSSGSDVITASTSMSSASSSPSSLSSSPSSSSASSTGTAVTAATSPDATPPVASTPTASPPLPTSSISSSSIDVLGTLLSVAAAATAASLLTGPPDHLMPHLRPRSDNNNNNTNANNASSLPSSPSSSESIPSSPLFNSRPTSPTSLSAASTTTGDQANAANPSNNFRQAWGSIRERLGLRPGSGSVPSTTEAGGLGLGAVGSERERERERDRPFSPDARDRMLAEMTRAFNLGLGMAGGPGQGQGQGQQGQGQDGEQSLVGEAQGAGADDNNSSQNNDNNNNTNNTGNSNRLSRMAQLMAGGSTTTASPSSSLPTTTSTTATSLSLPPEGSFERFLVDLQTDLRAALLGGAGESVGLGGGRRGLGDMARREREERHEHEHEEGGQQERVSSSSPVLGLSTPMPEAASTETASMGVSSVPDPALSLPSSPLMTTAATTTSPSAEIQPRVDQVVAEAQIEAEMEDDTASTATDDSMPSLNSVSESDSDEEDTESETEEESDEDEDMDEDTDGQVENTNQTRAQTQIHEEDVLARLTRARDLLASALASTGASTAAPASAPVLPMPVSMSSSSDSDSTPTSASPSTSLPTITSPSATQNTTTATAPTTATATTNPGRINWWRLYRFPPIAAPRAQAAADSVAANMTSSLAPLGGVRAGGPGPGLTRGMPGAPMPTQTQNPSESGSESTTTAPASPTASNNANANTNPNNNLVVPVIVVGLQSVSLPWARHANANNNNNNNRNGADVGAGTSAGEHEHEHEHEHEEEDGLEEADDDLVNDELAELERELISSTSSPFSSLGSGPNANANAAVNTNANANGSRGRRWQSRAANAFRSLRPGSSRQGQDTLGQMQGQGGAEGARREGPSLMDLDGPGSRTFLIYVIGGYYPPDHSIVTGEPDNLDSFEALLDLAELLGQVKPPTVSKEEIEKSGLEVIKATQLEEYEKDGKISSNCTERCLICLDDYQPEDDLRVLSCKHGFHMDCVDKWLQEGKNNCPACRSKGVSEDVTSTSTSTSPTVA